MINNDRLALFAVATGPRGILKTLFLTRLQVEKLLKFYYRNMIEGTNYRVWSNYPVEFWHTCEMTHKVVHLASEPLNMEALYTFDKELANGWVFIDELDQWFDRQDWNNASQKLTHSAMTQVRKKKLSMGATVQDLDWINGRIVFQADIEVDCREAAFTPFGHKLNLDLGVASFQKWKDLSGTQTGYMFKETGRTYDATFWGQHYWNCYDTYYQFDPTETRTRYKLKAPTKIIQIGGQPEQKSVFPDQYGNLPDNTPVLPYEKPRSAEQDHDQVLIAHLFQELEDKGESQIDIGEFWQWAQSNGLKGSPNRLGQYIAQTLKIKKGGNANRTYKLQNRERELVAV